MNRFLAAFHELHAWGRMAQLGPFEVVIRFKNPGDRFRAGAAATADLDAFNPTTTYGCDRGQAMGIPFKFEHAGLHSPSEVSEALRHLATEIDEAARPVPVPPLLSELTKSFQGPLRAGGGDVCGPFTPPHLERLAASEVPEKLGDEPDIEAMDKVHERD